MRRDTWTPRGQAPPDRPALKPYRGKPAVRNFREDNGDVGIIRSPVRAIVLPRPTHTGSESCGATREGDVEALNGGTRAPGIQPRKKLPPGRRRRKEKRKAASGAPIWRRAPESRAGQSPVRILRKERVLEGGLRHDPLIAVKGGPETDSQAHGCRPSASRSRARRREGQEAGAEFGLARSENANYTTACRRGQRADRL